MNQQIGAGKIYLILTAIFLLLLIKLWVIDDKVYVFTTLMYEAVIFFLILGVNLPKGKYWEKISPTLFYLMFLFHFSLSFLYSLFFNDVFERKLSLLGLKWGVVVFFFQNVFPWKIFALYMIILAVMLVAFNSFRFKEMVLNRKISGLAVVILLLLVFLLPLGFGDNLGSPYLDTIAGLREQGIKIYPANTTNNNLLFQKRDQFSGEIPYERVIVIVMEGTSYQDFLEDINNIPEEDNFFMRVRNDSHYYSNYYTTNQDSRTAVMAMLSSTFIPFEAYLYNNWQELYADRIKEKDNLIKLLNEKNYSTEFMISSVETPVVSRTYPWKKVHNLKEYDGDGEFICLHVMEYQHGCEDEIMLDDLKQAVTENQKLFLFQEMVYGHGYKYIQLKEKSLTEYYNDYLMQIYDFLLKEDRWEGTLLIIVSDHGPKDYNAMKTLYGYNIPLVMISPGFEYEEYDSLYSHLDFNDLFFGRERINNFVFFVGSTRSSLIGYVNTRGTYAVLKDDFLVGSGLLFDQKEAEERLAMFRNYEMMFTMGLI